jgi:hypothetical protein
VDMAFCFEHVNIIGWFKTNCDLLWSIWKFILSQILRKFWLVGWRMED